MPKHQSKVKKFDSIFFFNRPGPARVQYINSMSKKCSVLDEEDEAVLNLIAKCEWDLSKPPGITGSAKKDPEVEFHTLQSMLIYFCSSSSPIKIFIFTE